MHISSYFSETVISPLFPIHHAFPAPILTDLAGAGGLSALLPWLRPGLLTYQATLRMWPCSSQVGGALKPPEHKVLELSVVQVQHSNCWQVSLCVRVLEWPLISYVAYASDQNMTCQGCFYYESDLKKSVLLVEMSRFRGRLQAFIEIWLVVGCAKEKKKKRYPPFSKRKMFFFKFKLIFIARFKSCWCAVTKLNQSKRFDCEHLLRFVALH